MSSSSSYSPTQIEFMCSGGVWSLFCFLLFFLCYEQHSASRYPQNVIIFLLSLGFVLRCIWFFTQGEDIASSTNSAQRTTGFAIINRLAFLLLFSAMSMLIVMWTRIGVRRESCSHDVSTEEAKITTAIYDGRTVTIIYSSLFVVNLVLWVMIFVTTTNENFAQSDDSLVHRFNILLLAIACFLEASSVFFVGLFTAIRVERHIQFLMSRHIVHSEAERSTRGTDSFVSDAYEFLSRKNKLPHEEVVWQMVIFTSVIAAIMLARCVVIIYIVFFERSQGYNIGGQILYPYFYYQIPDFFITFIIAYGISPSQGLLRLSIQRLRANLICSKNISSDTQSKSSFILRRSLDSSGGSAVRWSFQSSSLCRSCATSFDSNKSCNRLSKRSAEEIGIDSLEAGAGGGCGGGGGGEDCKHNESVTSAAASRNGLLVPLITTSLAPIRESEAGEDCSRLESKDAPERWKSAVAPAITSPLRSLSAEPERISRMPSFGLTASPGEFSHETIEEDNDDDNDAFEISILGI